MVKCQYYRTGRCGQDGMDEFHECDYYHRKIDINDDCGDCQYNTNRKVLTPEQQLTYCPRYKNPLDISQCNQCRELYRSRGESICGFKGEKRILQLSFRNSSNNITLVETTRHEMTQIRLFESGIRRDTPPNNVPQGNLEGYVKSVKMMVYPYRIYSCQIIEERKKG